MFVKRVSAIFTSILFCFVLLTSCANSPSSITNPSPTSSAITPIVPIASPTLEPALTITPDTTPTHYTSQILLSGVGRPDDLAFDLQGHLLFSDFYNGTISRLNANGSVTRIVTGLAGPEGLVVEVPSPSRQPEPQVGSVARGAPGFAAPAMKARRAAVPN